MCSQERGGIGALKEGVYVKVFVEGMDLWREQGSLLHVGIMPALQKEGSKGCHRLIALVLRGRPGDLSMWGEDDDVDVSRSGEY